jgi:small-conductance mechanosensitive channel
MACTPGVGGAGRDAGIDSGKPMMAPRRRDSRPARLVCGVFAVALLVLAVAPGPARSQEALDADALRHVTTEAAPATVTVWNRPIVTLRATVGSLTPARRAAIIEAKVQDLPFRDLGLPVRAQPAQVANRQGVLVFVGPHMMFGILQEDLDPLENTTPEEAGEEAADHLGDALRARAEARRLPVLLRGIAASVGSTIAFVVLVWIIVRARHWMLERLRGKAERRQVYVLGVDIRPYAFAVLEGLARLTTMAVGLFAVYLWLTLVLSQFPYTQPWGEKLGRYLTGLLGSLGLGALRAMPGLFVVLVIFTVTRLVARAAATFFQAVEERRLHVAWLQPETAHATHRLAAVGIWLFAVTVAYPYIPGSNTDAFKGVSVFAGLMITLGSAGLVNQVMSGLVVVYARALRPGDLVQAGNTIGIVSEVGLLSTKLVTPKREEVTIPNAVLVGNSVVNYSKLAEPDGAVVSTTVTIGYDAPWRQVHALLTDAARRTPGVRVRPEPFVLQTALSDFYVEYELRAHIERVEERIRVLSALHGEIQDRFREAGVQIMSPHFEAQPPEPVLPPPDDAGAPGRRKA